MKTKNSKSDTRNCNYCNESIKRVLAGAKERICTGCGAKYTLLNLGDSDE